MTRRLFWEDMYMKEFDATVVSADGAKLVLDQTAFNPRGGGLVSDLGTINGTNLAEALKEGEEIVHLMASPSNLKAGDFVRLSQCATHDGKLCSGNRHAKQADRQSVERLGVRERGDAAVWKPTGEKRVDISANLHNAAADEHRKEIANDSTDVFRFVS